MSAVTARSEHARPLDDPEALDEREERPGERRGARALLDERPVDLLSERPGDLEHGLEVRLLLGQREELGHHHVVDRRDEDRLRADLELGRPREVLVADLPACGTEDEIDEDRAVVRLVEPFLRRVLRVQADRREGLERPVGVLFADEEVDVVVRRGPPRAKIASPPPSMKSISASRRAAAACFIVVTSCPRFSRVEEVIADDGYPVRAFPERRRRVHRKA
jgi:hypothetical protein